MCHEEAVTADADRQSDVVFLTDREAGHNEVEHVLLILGMKHNHAAVDEIGNFDIVRLNGQWSVHDPAGKHRNNRQPMPGP